MCLEIFHVKLISFLTIITSFIYLKDEQKRGDCASGVECFIKQYDVSDKKAIEEIQKMVANGWKDINEDCMRPTNAPKVLLQHFVNLIRVTDVFLWE